MASSLSIAGILRSPSYSPNHIGSDMAILNSVCAALRKRGYRVSVHSEAELMAGQADGAQVVVNMCREQAALARLQQMEDAGALVINSAYGIENCKRGRMAPRLLTAGVGYVDSVTVSTDLSVVDTLQRMHINRCWVKRADFHSMHKEDITFARSADMAQEVLQEYFLRGIGTAVIERHMEGNLVKFYGVRSTGFFRYHYPLGIDQLDAQSAQPVYEFDHQALAAAAERAANLLGVDIYGGDCMVGADGTCTIINFNDWPSFSPFRAEATKAIAKLVLTRIKKQLQ